MSSTLHCVRRRLARGFSVAAAGAALFLAALVVVALGAAIIAGADREGGA